jgi:site-specific DNA recombinase
MRAAIYLRISLDKTGKRAGVERQREDCQRLCDARGWQVVGIYEDNSVSAYSGRTRPAYERLTDDVAAGTVDVVVAWHTDRLWRSVIDQQLFVHDAKKAGLKSIVTMTAAIDPANADDEMISTLLTAVARKASADQSRRMVRRQEQKAEAGEFHGGPSGYGYRPDGAGGLVVDPAEAAIVAEMAARVLAGETQRSITLDMHRRGVTTTSGRPWRVDDIGKLLRSPRIAGLRIHHGVRHRAKWPAIITPEEHDQLVNLYAARVRGPRQGNNPKHLLAGRIRCGRCSRPMTVSMIRGTKRYRCQPKGMGGCGGISIVAALADATVTEIVLGHLDSEAMTAAVDAAVAAAAESRQGLAELLAQVQRDRAQLIALGDLLADGTLGADEYRRLVGKLRGRIEDAEQAVRAQSPTTAAAAALAGQGDRLRTLWQTMTGDERREVIGAVVARVTIHPGQAARFSSDRVEVTFAV